LIPLFDGCFPVVWRCFAEAFDVERFCEASLNNRLDQRLDEEVIAPGDRLIDAEPLVIMVDAVQQDALPLGPAAGEELVGTKRVEDRQRRHGLRRFIGQEIKEMESKLIVPGSAE